MVIISVSLDPEISLLAMFRPRNIGLTLLYVHVLVSCIVAMSCMLFKKIIPKLIKRGISHSIKLEFDSMFQETHRDKLW